MKLRPKVGYQARAARADTGDTKLLRLLKNVM